MEVCTPAVASVDCDNPAGPFEMDKRVCVRVSDPGFSPRQGPKVLLHLWYFYPHNLSLIVSSSMPVGLSWGMKDMLIVAGYTFICSVMACARMCVFVIIFILPISSIFGA